MLYTQPYLCECLLSNRYRVIALDLAGYGDTPSPSDPDRFGLAEEARLMSSALDEIIGGNEPFHLAGHSYGGGVALRLAYAMPRRISSLTLFEPTAFHLALPDDPALIPIHKVVRGMKAALQSGEREQAAILFIDYWNRPGAYAELARERQRIFCGMVEKVLMDFRSLLSEPLALNDYYRRIKIPTCVLTGVHSPASSLRIAELLSQTLIQTELHRVVGGHMAPITHAEDVNRAIELFLTRVDERVMDRRANPVRLQPALA
jgi:pimeloyl-ACP methyl ester carboxylesterase